MGPIILAAPIIHYTSTTTATAKKLSFTVKTDQRVCFSCTHASMHTMKIPVQKIVLLVETVPNMSYKIMPSSKGTLSVTNDALET